MTEKIGIEGSIISKRALCLFTDCEHESNCKHPYNCINIEVSAEHGGCIKFSCPHWKESTN